MNFNSQNTYRVFSLDIEKSRLLILAFLFSFYGLLNAQTVIIFPGDTNAEANTKIQNAFNNSDISRLEIRNRTTAINVTLTAQQQELDHNLEIVGSNTRPATFAGNSRGAHTQGNTNTILNFRSPLTIEPGCTNLTIQNLRWNNSWIACEARHRPTLDISNVIFDVTNPVNRGYFGKRILEFDNGFRGNIVNTSFLGFGFNAIIMDRTSDDYNAITGANEPISFVGFFNIQRCLFRADPRVFTEAGFTQGGTLVASALSIDAGNDEFPLLMDFNNSIIRASRFEDCRIAISKGANIVINGNAFVNDLARRDILHLEEFSRNIAVTNNTFTSNGPALDANDRHEMITLGAIQGAVGVAIRNNTFNQNNNRITSVVNGGGLRNITIENNTLNNVFGNTNYINFFRCGNAGINITQDNASNLGANRRRVDGACPVNNFPIQGNQTYVIRYRQGDTNLYLRANNNGTATLIALNNEPTENVFRWRVNFGDITAVFWNRYFIQNVGNNRYLEVPFGPTAPQQRGNNGTRYSRGTNFSNLACRRDDYPDTSRPGFMLLRNGDNYAIVPGGNEVRSHLRRIGNSVSVGAFISTGLTIGSEALQANWQFINTAGKAIDDLGEEVDFLAYPSPAKDVLNIPSTVEGWRIYDMQGSKLKSGTRNEIKVSDLSSGIYMIQTNKGEIFKFEKQ